MYWVRIVEEIQAICEERIDVCLRLLGLSESEINRIWDIIFSSNKSNLY